MLNISKGTIDAVLDKAHQQVPEEFSKDFLATLRLENKELHQFTDEFLTSFITRSAAPGMDREEIKKIVANDELLDSMVEKCGERIALATDARIMAATLVGVIYKCIKAEIEAEELEG
jgi:hypothetical protein